MATPPGPPRSATGRLLRTVLNRSTDLVAAGLRRRITQIRAEYGLSPLRVSVNAAMGRLPLFLVGNVTEMDYFFIYLLLYSSRSSLSPRHHALLDIRQCTTV